MNLRPYYKSIRQPDLFWVVIVLLNILIAGILVHFIFFQSASPARSLMVKAVAGLEQAADYNLHIYEHAGTHSISFRGQVIEGNISGLIPEHDITVYRKKGNLYLRFGQDSEWEKSDDVELEELNAFLTTPKEILQLIEEQLDHVQLGPEKGREDSIYKTIYWIIDSPEIWKTLFPAINTSMIEEGTISAEISAREFAIRQVKITLLLKTSQEERQIIQRTLDITVDKRKV